MELEGKNKSYAYIAGGIAVFIVCSIIQATGGSSMFSNSYMPPDSAFLDLLLNVTFWPGWILTVGLIVQGVKDLLMSGD